MRVNGWILGKMRAFLSLMMSKEPNSFVDHLWYFTDHICTIS